MTDGWLEDNKARLMSAVAQHLTVEEFDKLYADRKPYHEYWFGEAIQKSMPTWLHGLLQGVLIILLHEIGFQSGAEVKLKLSSEAQPLPDVIATSKPIRTAYPSEPFDVAIEILSPQDSMQYVLRKCRMYAKWGIRNVYVFDPEDRTAQKWNQTTNGLEDITEMAFENRPSISVKRIWSELDRQLDPPGTPE